MNINQAMPSTSKMLKASDLPDGQDVCVTIELVQMETIGQGEKAEEKPVVYFKGKERGLVLNKTNATSICGLYGPETDDWIGKAILIGKSWVDYQGQQVEAIRVRPRKPQPKAQPAKAAPAPAPTPAPAVVNETFNAGIPDDIPF